MNKQYELKNKRQTILDAARAAADAGDMETFGAKMREVADLNGQLAALDTLEAEETRFSGSGGALTLENDKGHSYDDAFWAVIRNRVSPGMVASDPRIAPLFNALTEGGGTPEGADGGYLVPVDFDNQIHELMRQLVSLESVFNSEEVTAPTGWRAVDTAPTAGFAEVAEMGTIGKDDQPKFTRVEYALKKYALRVPVSNELLSDNTANLRAYLARWYAKKGVITINKKLLALLDALTPSNLTVGKEVQALKSVLNKDLDPSIAANSVIITNQSGFDHLDTLVGTDGRGLLQPDPTSGTPMIFKAHRVICMSDAMLPNRVVTTTGATKGTYYPVYVGDMQSFGTLFRKRGLEVAATNIGGDAWATGSTELRGIMRLDAKTMDTAAAVKREIFIAASA